MVAGLFTLTSIAIDASVNRPSGKRRGSHDEVDSEATALVEIATSVIPEGIETAFFVMAAVDVLETPCFEGSKGLALGFAHMRVAHPGFRAPDITVVGADIEIATDSKFTAGVFTAKKGLAQTLKPSELVCVVRIIKGPTVGHVGAGDPNPTAGRPKDARIGVLGAVVVPTSHNVLEAHLREDRHTIPLALAMVSGLVAHCVEDLGGKCRVLHLGLLETDDLRAILGEPLLHSREPGLQRIHIPRHDSEHGG